ncbi:hypothetical protein [Rhodococcus sp. KRD162]|uniref:hypothetical protein n=1 Tax=Rhodococcus sp. KRD162 TaxID=2729725 RepID=UPI0019D1E607|nr:hypothetical protein [Rhodococcus sp. KRD162]
MIGVDRYGPVVAAVSGGFVAGYSIRESLGSDSFVAESSGVWFRAFVTAQWAGTIAVISAVIVLALVHSRRTPVPAAVAAVLGSVIVALPSFVPISSTQAVTTNAIGAGVLVGVCGHIAAGRRIPSAALAVGLLGSMLFYGAISALRPPRIGRWMVNLNPMYVESPVPLVLLVVTAVIVVVTALRAPAARFESSDAVVAFLLAFVYLVVYTYLGNTTSTAWMWTFAVVIAVVLTYGGALVLDGRDGRYLVLGLVIAASGVNYLWWSDASWWVLIGAASLFVTAVGVGLRKDLSTAALVVLALVTATGLIRVGGELGQHGWDRCLLHRVSHRPRRGRRVDAAHARGGLDPRPARSVRADAVLGLRSGTFTGIRLDGRAARGLSPTDSLARVAAARRSRGCSDSGGGGLHLRHAERTSGASRSDVGFFRSMTPRSVARGNVTSSSVDVGTRPV